MKNTTTVAIVPQCAAQLTNGEAAVAGQAAEALNVRERENSLQVVGTPTQIATLAAGDRLLAIDDDRLIALRGNDVVLPDGTVLATAQGTVVAAHVVGQFVVIDTTQERIYLHRAATGYERLLPDDAVPLLHIAAVGATTLSATVPEFTFSEPLSQWQSPLATADVAALTALVADACQSITTDATAQGMLTGPVLARYGVRLWDDSYLWLSQPVVVGRDTLATSYRATTQATTSDGSYVGAGACTLQLTAYRVAVSVAQGVAQEWHDLVKAIDVLVTDAVLPYSTATPDYRLSTVRSGGTRTQTLELGPTPLSRQAIATRLLAGKWHVAASTTSIEALGQGQFASADVTTGSTQVLPGVTPYTLTNASTGAKVAQDTIDAAIEASAQQQLPACSMVMGGRLYSGGGQVRLLDPWSALPAFDGTIAATACTVRTITTVATEGGTVQVERTESLPFTPTALNPLACSPHEGAMAMRVEVTSGEGTLVAEASLTLCASQGIAAHITTQIDAHTLTTGSTTAAVTAQPLVASPGTVAASGVGNPLITEWSRQVTDGRVLAIAAAGKPIYNGGFGRYPLYAFTSSGVYALPLTTSSEARLLSRKIINAAVPPADGDGAVWFVTTLGQLCSAAGATVTVALRDVQATGMVWNDAERELCLLMPDGTMMLLMPSGRTTALTLAPSQLFGDGVHAMAVMPTGAVLDLHQEQTTASTTVQWLSHPVELSPRMLARPAVVQWNVAGSDMDVTMSVLGERGNSCHGFVVSRVRVRGTLGAPVAVRLAAQPLRTLRLQVQGTMPAGTLLLPVTLVQQR